MKSLKLYMVALLGLFLIAACGGGGESGNSGGSSGGSSGGGSTAPKTYTQSVSLPATAGEQVITLSNLNSSVSSVSSTPSWLVVSPQFYSSGAPTLKLEYQQNTDSQERKCTITVLASAGDKVSLTITQQAGEQNNGIEDIHNEPTDQPAFAPSR